MLRLVMVMMMLRLMMMMLWFNDYDAAVSDAAAVSDGNDDAAVNDDDAAVSDDDAVSDDNDDSYGDKNGEQFAFGIQHFLR